MPREDEKKVLEEIVDKPMGDDTIKNVLPKCKIIMYSDLKNYHSMAQILPKVKSYAIILYQDSPNSGHWTAIMKPNENEYEYFDSYGTEVDHPLTWTSDELKKSIGIHAPYLSNLLRESGKKIVRNKTQFQSKGGDIATCGRHCCMRIQMMKNRNMNIHQYANMMKNVKKKLNKSFDELVGVMISPEAD